MIDESFLSFVRTRPCFGCNKGPVDAHHVRARAWRESKRNDYVAVPLCRRCHGRFHDSGPTAALEYLKKTPADLVEEVSRNLVEFFRDSMRTSVPF